MDQTRHVEATLDRVHERVNTGPADSPSMHPMSSSSGRSIALESGRWLYGRGLDLWIGCGFGYVALLPVLLGYGLASGVQTWSTTITKALTIGINAPHYGATVLRVYAHAADRARYRFFALYATVAVALAFAVGTRSWWVASLLITLYITWSPWHFAGQNYGIAVMFLRRRGIGLDATTKRLLYLSFALSALLVILETHGTERMFSVTPPTLPAPEAPRLLRLGIPGPVLQTLLAVTGLAYLGCLTGVARRLRGNVSAADQLPAWALVLTQALWYVVPVLLVPPREELLPFTAVWVSTAHSAQYLWITAYYARRSNAREPARPFLLKSLIAGCSVQIVPALLFGPDLLGELPWDAGLAALTFAALNIHHFLLDGAIWKLRDGRIARVLLHNVFREAGTVAPEPNGIRRP